MLDYKTNYQHHNDQEVIADVTTTGNKKISVANYDQRPEILKLETAPEVTGWMKGIYGNSFKVTTESDLPLLEGYISWSVLTS